MDLEKQSHPSTRTFPNLSIHLILFDACGRERHRFAHFRNLVTWSTDLDKTLFGRLGDRIGTGQQVVAVVLCGIFGFPGRATCEVSLMLLALGVREIGAFVRVERETKTAL